MSQLLRVFGGIQDYLRSTDISLIIALASNKFVYKYGSTRDIVRVSSIYSTDEIKLRPKFQVL